MASPDIFVTARSIADWANGINARAVLPHLVHRLIIATTGGITEIDFPSHESIQRPGFDGTVASSAGNPWVPVGRSNWELSTEKSVRKKADDDFKKRTSETSQEEQQQTTYVFLTPRKFTKKKSWAREKQGASSWLGVRAYDADDLEQWAVAAPAGVTAWFGRQLGTRPPGVDDVAERWNAISNAASCPLLPAVFLAGRERSVQRVQQWLSAEPTRLEIDCRSPVEVVDFFCAAVAEMDDHSRIAVESRSIIIQQIEAWAVLRDSTIPAVLVIDPALVISNEDIGRAVRSGHHVLVATESTIFTGTRDSELERASEFELAKALEESGYSPVKAEQFARASGGSLAILKHRLSSSSSKPTPRWAPEISPEVITACLLLGGWGSNEADRSAFGAIVGRDYAACEGDLQRMAKSLDPLLLHAAGNWRLISKDHAWSLFEDRVAPVALTTFESFAVDILADDDPRYELPEDERLYATIKGHIPKYSDTIKKHVAETLAFLGAFGAKLEAGSSIDIEAAIDRIVASVLSPSCTWQRWASLGSRLPLLAEASPASFLRAVTTSLALPSPELVTLLIDEEDPFFGHCNHAGLLWALETLAWAKEHVAKVARLLLVLADRDTGRSRWANRPAGSLREILSYWMPQTTANVDDRIRILDLLAEANRKAAWPVLRSLLPEAHGGISTPTHKPYWRAWANDWERGATRSDSMAFVTATAQRVIRDAGLEPDRWNDVFGEIGRFPYTVRPQLVAAAEALSRSDIADADRRVLSEQLSKQIALHRSFQEATWAMPAELLDSLEPICERLKPQSSALRNAWLFQQWPREFFERGGRYEHNQEALNIARRDAIQEILKSEGFDGITSLAEHAESPMDVGNALAFASGDAYLDRLIPIRLEGHQRDLAFVSGFIWRRYWPNNWEWVDAALSSCCTATSKAHLLSSVPFSPNAWNRVQQWEDDVARLYWARCRAFNPDLTVDEVATAVKTLCRHDRPSAAIDMLWMATHKESNLDSETLLAPLEALMALPAEKAEAQRSQLDGHHIQEIIGTLQDRTDIDDDRLLRIEWHYIHLLGEHSQQTPRRLAQRLSSSPEFFNEVLSFCYKSKHESDTSEVTGPQAVQRYLAEHAFELLHNWNVVPGTADDGTIDECILREWCTKARAIADGSGRLGICDTHIGQLFAKSKQEDHGGAWPCAAIRHVADEIETDALGSGLSCGILNLRGACVRGGGGNQERSLAQQFRERADRIRFESQFVTRVLDSVAKSYETEAKWWDERDRWEK